MGAWLLETHLIYEDAVGGDCETDHEKAAVRALLQRLALDVPPVQHLKLALDGLKRLASAALESGHGACLGRVVELLVQRSEPVFLDPKPERRPQVCVSCV